MSIRVLNNHAYIYYLDDNLISSKLLMTVSPSACEFLFFSFWCGRRYFAFQNSLYNSSTPKKDHDRIEEKVRGITYRILGVKGQRLVVFCCPSLKEHAN